MMDIWWQRQIQRLMSPYHSLLACSSAVFFINSYLITFFFPATYRIKQSTGWNHRQNCSSLSLSQEWLPMAGSFIRVQFPLFWVCLWKFPSCMQQVWNPNCASSSTGACSELSCECIKAWDFVFTYYGSIVFLIKFLFIFLNKRVCSFNLNNQTVLRMLHP